LFNTQRDVPEWQQEVEMVTMMDVVSRLLGLATLLLLLVAVVGLITPLPRLRLKTKRRALGLFSVASVAFVLVGVVGSRITEAARCGACQAE
jgi:hypothetical protein